MTIINASKVDVFVDDDYGEGHVSFIWDDDLLGWEQLQIEFDGHCSRRMGYYSGMAGISKMILARDRIAIKFTKELAAKLRFDQEVEIHFSVTDEEYRNMAATLEGLA